MGAPLSSLTPELCTRRYPEFKFNVSSLWLRQFKSLLGYEDDQVHDDQFVPDVFLACMRNGDFKIFELLDIELDRLLHTTQSFEFHGSVKIGDEVTTKSNVTKVRQKLNSANPFVALEITTECFSQDSKLLAITKGTIFIREAVK